MMMDVFFGCSLPLTRHAEEFICSVVVGKDLVPRLGFVTLQKLREKMISAVTHSNKPKVGEQHR